MAKIHKIISLFLFIVAIPIFANAATLSLQPQDGSLRVGENISVRVLVSSPDQSINAIEAGISFPGDVLEVISISTDNTIIDFWPVNPIASASTGVINFTGLVFNPGFQGGKGELFTINYKVKQSMDARITFAGSSVLANDGKGTEVLSETSGTTLLTSELFDIVIDPIQSAKQSGVRIFLIFTVIAIMSLCFIVLVVKYIKRYLTK